MQKQSQNQAGKDQHCEEKPEYVGTIFSLLKYKLKFVRVFWEYFEILQHSMIPL
jgi:hypothetical protein